MSATEVDSSIEVYTASQGGEPPSNPKTIVEHSTTTPRTQSHPSELATKNLLCTSCKDAVAACSALQSHEKPPRGKSRLCSYADRKALESSATMCPSQASNTQSCHLCSLILGRIRQAEFWRQPPEDLPPPPEPINVYFTVGRTGGTTLEIEVGESDRQRSVGYLVVVPADHEEAMSVSDTPDNPFFKFSATSPKGTTGVRRSARLAKSLASEASFSLAREWLTQCLESHAECTEAARLAVGRPYRLVDVGNDNSVDPKIIVMDFSRPVPPYLTLSHCWGGAKILRLLLGNIDILRKGIPMHELPKTFQDAVVITRRLGYQYIWMDSLCIIQDSPSDWKTNAAIMGEIYAGSVCTVAALTARNAYDGGCFFEQARSPLSYRHCQLSPHWTVKRNSYLAPDMRLRPSWSPLEPFPLHTRAWVVQERLLAPRTLYYGATGLAWECAECSATENVPHGEVAEFSPKASFFEIMRQLRPAVQEEERGPDPELQEKVHALWLTILAAYGRCSLTRFDDRLVAVSGVLRRVEATTGWRSMWGIWRDSVLVDLLWLVDRPSVRPPTSDYLAPTWSWAGLEGAVFMAVGDGKGCEWAAEVVEDGVLQDGRGYVKLKAMARQMTLTA
ncbi:HET-domain-containing protein [Trametes versicolor FP-101664 SS1]|uniref:HET-domain-containing protein n=1 Tax=Trametes versicolor (strain FP-101664) TaxID=717944 RepID=UPI0004624A04|nr:HET-domain-containing protein [Trametes versicolor FP-101664 SS1]EIW60372.1 HET-domain-containing protein [Trametes versicolor FP-101664 SS1]